MKTFYTIYIAGLLGMVSYLAWTGMEFIRPILTVLN